MKKLIQSSLIGVLLFIFVYISIGIIKMPAYDMKDTIQKGDILLYRKFLLFLNHKHIVVYKYNYNEENDSSNNFKYYFIQRIIGLPGDSIFIDSGRVYINHQLEEENELIQKNYTIQVTDSIEKLNHLEALIEEKTLISKKLEYSVSISKKMYYYLKQDTNVTGIYYEVENPIVYQDAVFPYNENIKWNKHFFGPFYLPRKNDKLLLTKDNLNIYFPIIQKEEKLSFIQNDSLFINGKYTEKYQFKNDYYFVMGDNRDNAIDSRYIGPIKKTDIVGIVFYNPHLR